MKPQFVFIGPTKSGTTWIDSYLRARTEVLLPKLTKETFFFDKQYDKGLAWYEAQFGSAYPSKVCVEIAPSLFAKPEATRRLAGDLPAATVICTLRNPIDRAVSHYFHYLKAGAPDVGFAAMCEHYPDIVEAGLYHKHLLTWEEALGRDRLLILSYDKMRSEPLEFCADLCRAIGIDYIPPSPELLTANVNEASVPRNRLVARVVRKSAAGLRRAGVHQVVNLLRGTKLKRFAFGPPPDRTYRESIREQAMEFHDLFNADFQQLEPHFGQSVNRPAILPCSGLVGVQS